MHSLHSINPRGWAKSSQVHFKKRHLVPVSVMIFESCHLILFVSSTNYFQIVRRRCCLKSWEVHLLCKLQGVHFAQGTNVWFVCTEMAKIWCVISSDTFWRIQAVWAGQRSGTWRSERVSWVQDSHHRLGPQNFLVYTHCEVVTMHSIPIQWLH